MNTRHLQFPIILYEVTGARIHAADSAESAGGGNAPGA